MLLSRQLDHGVMSLMSHAGDGATTQGCTACGKVVQPQARSIKVLSQHDEVGLACQLSLIFMSAYSRVITGKIS
jgi:hypothetical protein